MNRLFPRQRSRMAGIAIDVINKMRRPLPGHVQEGQSGAGIITTIDADAPTAMAFPFSTGLVAGTNSTAGRYQPSPNTGIRIIGQHFTQALGGEHYLFLSVGSIFV
jgi:hypothetical protein